MNRKLNIGINAQFLPNEGFGGVVSVVTGLLAALAKLDGPEIYTAIGHFEQWKWLKDYLGSNQRLIQGPPLTKYRTELFGMLPKRAQETVSKVWHLALSRTKNPVSLVPPMSDGFFESKGFDVMHFPYQHYFVCSLPTIFNPHDLQHLHLPQFFSPRQIVERELRFREGCQFANTVVVGSNWIKQDVVKQYGIHEDKIQIIPWAPPTVAYKEPDESVFRDTVQKYSLNKTYCFYPAMTWPHKNHIRLLQAIASLRDNRDLRINLICTGFKNQEHWPQIESAIKQHSLEEQVSFLGMVSREELRVIYRQSQFVVVPTLFEAASGPVYEAWQEKVPVTCSTVTSLPEQVRDSALLFDPDSTEAIEDALYKMTTDQKYRNSLVSKGQKRLADFSWDKTAKTYRAVYRNAARCPLSEEDKHLLRWDWMKNSEG